MPAAGLLRAENAGAIRGVLGVLVGILARLWLGTLRVTVHCEGLEQVADRPWVMAFLHGTQWPLLASPRRRRTWVMVSWSRDGMLQARALRVLGFSVVRGSSSRGGARGLAELVRALREGDQDAAFAVDGPRGPYGVAKGGARLAAQAAGGVLVPVGVAVESGTVLGRTWDRYRVAWPFSRVTVHMGPPIEPISIVSGVDDVLGRAIEGANVRAHHALAGRNPQASGRDRAARQDACGAVRLSK